MTFSPGRPYRLHPQVVIRPESFGALAYHFGNRRLTFFNSKAMVMLVAGLGDHPSAAAALDALGVDAEGRRRYEDSLARLVESEVICEH
jgi:putative mycofactocin binding protein MftB